jgi:O-antigen/teichoic acid export membrane protein
VTQRISTSLAGLIAAQAVQTGAVLIAAPVLVHGLGLDGYGLLGMAATLLLLFGILDAGLAAALTRRLAVEGPARGAVLLAAAERLVLAGAVALAGVGAALAWPVSAALVSPLPREVLALSLALAVLAAVAFWPATLYQSGLNGRGRQAEAALVQAAGAVLRWGGGVLIVLGPGLDVRFVLGWQALANAGVTAVLRLMLRRGLPSVAPSFAGIRRYAAEVSLVALLGAGLMVIDRLSGAAMLTVARFGIYTLVVQVAQMLGVLGVMVHAVWFPRISAALGAAEEREVHRLLGDALQVKAILAMPAAATLALLPHATLHAWTGSASLVSEGGLALSALAAAYGVGAVVTPVGFLDLARGTMRRVTRLSALAVAALAVSAPLGAWLGGVAGLGLATATVLGLRVLVYVFGPGTPLGAHARAVLRPLAVTSAAAAAPPLLAALLPLPAGRIAAGLVVWAAWLAGCAAAGLASATGRMALGVALDRLGLGRRQAS